jgi:MFS family permease
VRGYLSATFESLRYRNYRRYIVGQGVSVIGTWMQKVAQAWLVLELTDSGTLLGVTAALQQLPTLLLTPWGGLLADRVDKRKILLCTQTAAAVPALILGILTLSGHVTIWIVFILAVVLGIIEAIDKPARMTFVSDIVDPKHITNAVTLNNIVQNMGKVVGPALAGIMIATVGLGYSFLANSASFIAVLSGLWLIRPEFQQKSTRAERSKGQLIEGVRYVRHRRDLFGPLILMTTTGMLAYNWQVVLPLLARDTFDGDAQVAGLMFTAMGIGAVVGGLAVAGSLKATSGRLVATGLIFALIMIGAALAPTLIFALIMLSALGAASVSFRALATSLMQLRAAPAMRGRVVSLLIIATNGTTPIGGPLIGWISQEYGARSALILGGVTTALAAGATFTYMTRKDPSTDDTVKELAVPTFLPGELSS